MLSYKNRYRIDLIKKAAPLASSLDASAAESLESCSRPDLDDLLDFLVISSKDGGQFYLSPHKTLALAEIFCNGAPLSFIKKLGTKAPEAEDSVLSFGELNAFNCKSLYEPSSLVSQKDLEAFIDSVIERKLSLYGQNIKPQLLDLLPPEPSPFYVTTHGTCLHCLDGLTNSLTKLISDRNLSKSDIAALTIKEDGLFKFHPTSLVCLLRQTSQEAVDLIFTKNENGELIFNSEQIVQAIYACDDSRRTTMNDLLMLLQTDEAGRPALSANQMMTIRIMLKEEKDTEKIQRQVQRFIKSNNQSLMKGGEVNDEER